MSKYEKHVTHTGEIVTGERLQAALTKVANHWLMNAVELYMSNDYPAHVTEAVKRERFSKDREFAGQIMRGEATGFTIWQRVNIELTGECVAFLQ